MPSQAQKRFEKLPLSINIPDQAEVIPVVSADGKTLYFARTRLGMDSSTVFDIWESRIRNDSQFAPPEFIGGNLASSYGVAVLSVSPDNNTLYLLDKLHGDSPPNERLYVSHKTSLGWSIPDPIKIKNVNPKGLYTDYAFGPDQRTLIMAVDRDSSIGDRDLYVSFFREMGIDAGTWTMPLWLGSDINSQYTEMTPYLAADNKTLYFSSNRPGGIGEVDVYRSWRLDDSWQNWSKPEDLGHDVNRPGRTSFYSEDAAGKYAYLTWRKSDAEPSAIYRVKVTRHQAVALLMGTVTDAAGKPLFAQVRYERLDRGSRGKGSGEGRSDPTTGNYQLTLPAGCRYAVRAEKEGYFPTSENIDLSELKDYETIEKNLRLNKIETGVAITMKNVFFETDRATLLPASFAELDRVIGLLHDHPEFKFQIAGYTDSTGSAKHNEQLSKDRAEAVVSYLTSHDAPEERLSAIGYGPAKPIATNTTEEGRAQNRRVEFILISNQP
ncbi:MAG TPA: OmpA family protein [Candidatus Kapabacteria bacterium]